MNANDGLLILLRQNKRIELAFERPVGINAAGVIFPMEKGTQVLAAAGDGPDMAVGTKRFLGQNQLGQSFPGKGGNFFFGHLGPPRTVLCFKPAAAVAGQTGCLRNKLLDRRKHP